VPLGAACRRFAGTYDEQWLDQRAPSLPEDMDASVSTTAASPGLTAELLFRWREAVALQPVRDARKAGDLRARKRASSTELVKDGACYLHSS
jgi:hypothetical protein